MNQSYDLRAALDCLRPHPGQLIETARSVNPRAEITGIYRYVGARGTVARPTKLGPAMLFRNVEGYPDASVLIGLLSDRARVGLLLGVEPERLGWVLKEALEHPIAPVVIPNKGALCQENIYRAEESDFDLRRIIPAPLNTETDAGPYITMGLCYAHDPEEGFGNITIHRLCIQGRDRITMGFGGEGTRHIGAFKEKARRLGRPLPISISIGVDPAIAEASCFQSPATPLGFDELSIAGALRGRPVELTHCLTIDEYAIANAEYVIEGELYPDELSPEDVNTGTGEAMPEFAGYIGAAKTLPTIHVKAVTCRSHPIMQICIGASEEHVNMAGIPEEAGILQMVDRALPGLVKNVYCPPSGGGKLMAILQIQKRALTDEGKQKQAALLAFGACTELKNIMLVDEDVDIFDPHDVMWALTTRFKTDLDLSIIQNVRCHGADPSQKPFYDPLMRDRGLATKTIFDCTVPFDLREHFVRASFMEVDDSEFL